MVSESELWEVLESCQHTVRPEWKAAEKHVNQPQACSLVESWRGVGCSRDSTQGFQVEMENEEECWRRPMLMMLRMNKWQSQNVPSTNRTRTNLD